MEDGKYGTLTEEQQPAMFFPILQIADEFDHAGGAIEGRSAATGDFSAGHAAQAGCGAAVHDQTWTKTLDSALFASRMATISLGVLGVLGAMLAVTGIFGMAAYSVSRRLRELGIRIALGAQRREVLDAALGRALRLLVFGSVAGLVLGLAATKVLAFIVYQASPRDPLVLCGVVLIMLLLGLVAAWIPARNALKASPLMLLREE